MTPWLLHEGVIQGPSSLTRNLPGPFSAASAAFDARVRSRFPPGTAETELVAELSRQGFRPGDRLGGERQMVRRQDSFICNKAARIFWRTDEARKVRGVRGVYREEGCL